MATGSENIPPPRRERRAKMIKLLRVWRDDFSESPRRWDNLGVIVAWHRNYNLGDQQSFPKPDDFLHWLRVHKKSIGVCLPLYLLDHGLLRLRTTPFGDPWDSGQVGWIYTTNERIRRTFGVKRVTEEHILKAREFLQEEIATYNQWLAGDIYGFTLFEVTADHIALVDTVGGFYGDNLEDNGMFYHVPDDLREPLHKVGRLYDGLVVSSLGDEIEQKRVRPYLMEHGLLTPSFMNDVYSAVALLGA